MTQNVRITVMGIGNPLVRDEGFGPRVVEELLTGYEIPESLQVMDCGTMGLTILGHLRDCDVLIVVDALDATGQPAGTILRLTPEDVRPNEVLLSAHDVRFADVLDAAEIAGYRPPIAEVIGVQVADIGGIGIGLTPEVEEAVPRAIGAVLAVLAEHGVELAVRTDSAAPDDATVLTTIRSLECPRTDYGTDAERS